MQKVEIIVETNPHFSQCIKEGTKRRLMEELQNVIVRHFDCRVKEVSVKWRQPDLENIDALPVTVYVEFPVSLWGLVLGAWNRRQLKNKVADLLRKTTALSFSFSGRVWIRPQVGARFEEVHS